VKRVERTSRRGVLHWSLINTLTRRYYKKRTIAILLAESERRFLPTHKLSVCTLPYLPRPALPGVISDMGTFFPLGEGVAIPGWWGGGYIPPNSQKFRLLRGASINQKRYDIRNTAAQFPSINSQGCMIAKNGHAAIQYVSCLLTAI
jgi:hypothetical protein